jgi:hypothetical protein
MEVREIVDTEVNELSIVVKFRIDRDSDDVIRSYEFLKRDIEDSGYEVFYKDEFDDDFDENWDEETDWDFDLDSDYQDIDEDELISYMNEFFLINGDLPEPEAY